MPPRGAVRRGVMLNGITLSAGFIAGGLLTQVCRKFLPPGAAKEFFTSHNVPFSDFNVASDLPKRQEMIQKSGQMGVPVIMIGDEITVGFDEDRLKELLHIAA